MEGLRAAQQSESSVRCQWSFEGADMTAALSRIDRTVVAALGLDSIRALGRDVVSAEQPEIVDIISVAPGPIASRSVSMIVSAPPSVGPTRFNEE